MPVKKATMGPSSVVMFLPVSFGQKRKTSSIVSYSDGEIDP
jgi:hypothetical protein